MRRRGGFFLLRRYSLVTQPGYVPADDPTPDGTGGGPGAPVAGAAGRKRGRPRVPRRAHGPGPLAAPAARRAGERAGVERLAGAPSLRPPLRVDVGVGALGRRVGWRHDGLRLHRRLGPGAGTVLAAAGRR